MPLNTSVSAVPAVIYTPSGSGHPHAVITNTGTATLYVGQKGVTAANGLPLAPNQQIPLVIASFTLYAVSGYTPTATTTTTTAAVVAGTGTVAVTAGTGLVNTGYVLIASAAAAEVVQIISGGTTTTLTTTAPSYDHASGVSVTLVTPQATSAGVNRGAS